MEDDVFHVAVGQQQGVPLCQPHNCHLCGTLVDLQGTHGLHCCKMDGKRPDRESQSCLGGVEGVSVGCYLPLPHPTLTWPPYVSRGCGRGSGTEDEGKIC